MKSGYRQLGDHLYKLEGRCDPSGCGSWCCKNLVFVVEQSNPDDPIYYFNHGVDTRIRPDGKIALLVGSRCIHLSPTGKCLIYDDRPAICHRYASLAADAFKSPACTLRWVPVSGREAQIALSKLRGGG